MNMFFYVILLCVILYYLNNKNKETFKSEKYPELNFIIPKKFPKTKNPYKNPPVNDQIDYDIVNENNRILKSYTDVQATVLKILSNYTSDDANILVEYVIECAKTKSLTECEWDEFWSFAYQKMLNSMACIVYVLKDKINKKTFDSTIKPWIKKLVDINMNIKNNGKEDLSNLKVIKNNVVYYRIKNILYLLSVLNENAKIEKLKDSILVWLNLSVAKENVFLGDADRQSRTLNYSGMSFHELKYVLGFLSKFYDVNKHISLLNSFIITWNKDIKTGGKTYQKVVGTEQIRIPRREIKLLNIDELNKLSINDVVIGKGFI